MPIKYEPNFKLFLFSDWTAVGTRNTKIAFDLDSCPLQIQTDSVVGSGDVVWVRFIRLTGDGPGISIKFNNPPTYSIGRCSNISNEEFTLPGADKHKIWTISKQNDKLQLNGNGVELFDFNFKESSELDCKKMWALDFAHIKFMSTVDNIDTASDMFRQLTKGKQFSPNNCDLYVFRGSDVAIITAIFIIYAIYIKLLFTNVCKAVC